jgi:feruloyl esterase
MAISTASAAVINDESCTELNDFNYPSLRIEKTEFRVSEQLNGEALPPHCVITGFLEERIGSDGKNYATGFELRLPSDWNQRFLFQGGGGTDGSVQPAIGRNTLNQPAALTLGYAVATTDGGHHVGGRGDSSFGADRKALIDYGYNSLDITTKVAKSLIQKAYDSYPKYSYFLGNSNGGRQGLIAAQRLGNHFDGILAGSPIKRQTRGHVATAWSLVTLSKIAPKDDLGRPIIAKTYSETDLALINNSIIKQCDNLDGLQDGIVDSAQSCNFDISEVICADTKNDSCISKSQADAFVAIHEGPVNSKGEELYAPFYYDAGSDFSVWHVGTAKKWPNNSRRAVNTSIKNVFQQPSNPNFDPYKFDFDNDIAAFDAAAEFVNADTPNMDVFKQSGGKLIVYHGTGDSGISAADTARWYEEVRERYGISEANSFSRFFMLSGVMHNLAGSGPTTFPGLNALVAWVEEGKSPDNLTISGGKPARTRPMCPYPTYVHWDSNNKAWGCQ